MAMKEDLRRLPERQRADIAWLMRDERGRRVVYQLLEHAAVFHSCYSDNALDMARREGRREQGLWLLDQVSTHAPEEFHLMQQEARHERATREHRSSGTADG